METGCAVIEDKDKTSQGVIAVEVQTQTAAVAILQTDENETDTAVNVDVNNSTTTLQAVNSQESDLLGIENLAILSNQQSNDAIKFIASHIGQFHELVNQKSIKDRQLNVLIQVIGKISSPSCNLDVQTHLLRIVTNQNFLGNISSYMRDSMAPRVDLVKYEATRSVFYSTNKPYCTDNFALTHLQTYFKFVEENLKELGSTEEAFEKGFEFFKQLVSSYDQNEEKQSNCAISKDDVFSCSSRKMSTISLRKTPAKVNVNVDSSMNTESLRSLLAKRHKDVIKFIDSHLSQFKELLNQKSISNPQLIALITFIGVKLCSPNSSLPELRIKFCLVVLNFNFVRNVWNYTKRNLASRSGRALKSLPSLDSNSRATFAPKVVLRNLLKFFRFVENNLMEAAPNNFAECFNLLTQLEASYKDVKKDLQAPIDPITISVSHQSKSESATKYVCNTNSTENLLGIQVLSTLLTKNSDEVISTVHNQLGELSKLVYKSITPSHLNVLLEVLVSKICTFVTASQDQDVHVQQLQREILTIFSDSKFLKKLRKHLNKVAKSFLESPTGQQILTTNETNENPPEMTLNYTAVEVFESVCQYYYFLLVPKIPNDILLEFDLDVLERNITSACEVLEQINSLGKVGEFSDQNPQAFQILHSSWEKLNTCLSQCTSKELKTDKTKVVSPAVKVLRRSATTTSGGDHFPSTESVSRIRSGSLLQIQVLLFLLTEDSNQVIKTIHNQRGALGNLIAGSMKYNHLDVLLQILGSKVCSIVENADIKRFQQEIIVIFSNSKFFQKLENHMTKLIKLSERSQDPIPGSSAALINSAAPNSTSGPIQVFKNVLEFYTFLNTTEIRDLISLSIYEELAPHVKAIRQLLHSVTMSKGPLREVFSLDKNLQDFNNLQSSFKKLGSSLNVYLSSCKQLQVNTTASSSSTEIPVTIPAQIILQAQNATSKQPQQQQDPRSTSNTSSQPVNSTAAFFTIDRLNDMKQMPADQVFNLICIERKHFKNFITQEEISDKRLNLLISLIGSKLCGRTVFVHFQKYLVLMLLEESFLKKIYTFTREIVRHISKKPTPPPYSSNTEIFESLYKLYNLQLIYCENPPAQLIRNIRSAYGILQNVIHNKNKLSVSTVTELQRIADLFKTLVATIIGRTKMIKAISNEESNVKYPDVDRDADAPSPAPPVNSDPLGLHILAKLLESSPSTVMEFLHERRCHLSELVSEPIIMDRRLNVLLQIVGSKLCASPVLFVENSELHQEVLESVTTPVFLTMIFDYKNVLRNLVLSPSFDGVFRKKGKPPNCSAMDIFAHSFHYYKYLLTIEINDNDTFMLPYSQLLININAAALVLDTVEAEGKMSLFSDKNPAAFQQLRDTAKFLQECFASNPEPSLPLSALLELESATIGESKVQSPVPIPGPEPEALGCDLKSDLSLFFVASSEPVSVSDTDTDTVTDVIDCLIFEIEVQELEITNYLGVPGFVKSVFFIDRDDEPCQNDESFVPAGESTQNDFKADFLVALCRHVILQNYEASEVKVLVSGGDQALLVKNVFETLENPFCSVDVGPLSNYCGIECDVMILSLEEPNVNNVDIRPFLNALYKARHGCYILGNKNHLLKSNQKMWTQFFSKFEDDESIGDKLELRCQIHKTDFLVGTPADFRTKSADGGCCRPCDMPLENCEHCCQKFCHVVDRHHEDYKCQILIDAKLKCGHMSNVECWRIKTDPLLENLSILCDSVCGAELDCGHLCFDKCHVFLSPGQETTGVHPPCPEIIEARLPCNHIVEKVPCFQVINKEVKPSFQNDPNNKCTVLIKVKLPCGFEYMENCDVLRSQNYINRTCESLCTRHCAKGHPCGRVHKCCVNCEPCEGRVSQVLPCGHTVSDVACHLDISQLECSQKNCKKADCIVS